MMFDIDYCKEAGGDVPAKEFIDGLRPKMKAKVLGRLALLEEYGPRLPMPFARPLKDGIYELRTPQGSDITRMLYFFVIGERVIVTHGFVKKSQKTPKREIERALRMREEWKSQNE